MLSLASAKKRYQCSFKLEQIKDSFKMYRILQKLRAVQRSTDSNATGPVLCSQRSNRARKGAVGPESA